MRRTLSDKVNNAFDSGMSISEIASHFGYGQNTVRNMLTPERIAEAKLKKAKKCIINDTDVANIIGQYQMGRNIEDIAKKMNYTVASVQREIDLANRAYNPNKSPIKPEFHFDWRLKVPSIDLLTYDDRQKVICYMMTKF